MSRDSKKLMEALKRLDDLLEKQYQAVVYAEPKELTWISEAISKSLDECEHVKASELNTPARQLAKAVQDRIHRNQNLMRMSQVLLDERQRQLQKISNICGTYTRTGQPA